MNREIRTKDLYKMMHEEYTALKEGMYGMERDLSELEKYIGDAANNSLKTIRGENFSKALRIFRSEVEGGNIYLSKLTSKIRELDDVVETETTKDCKESTQEFLTKYSRSYNCMKLMRDETEKMRFIAFRELENPIFMNGKLAADMERVLTKSMHVNRLMDIVSAQVSKSLTIGNVHQIIDVDASLDQELKASDKRGSR